MMVSSFISHPRPADCGDSWQQERKFTAQRSELNRPFILHFVHVTAMYYGYLRATSFSDAPRSADNFLTFMACQIPFRLMWLMFFGPGGWCPSVFKYSNCFVW